MPAKRYPRLKPQHQFDGIDLMEQKLKIPEQDIYTRTAEFMQNLGSLDPVALLDSIDNEGSD